MSWNSLCCLGWPWTHQDQLASASCAGIKGVQQDIQQPKYFWMYFMHFECIRSQPFHLAKLRLHPLDYSLFPSGSYPTLVLGNHILFSVSISLTLKIPHVNRTLQYFSIHYLPSSPLLSSLLLFLPPLLSCSLLPCLPISLLLLPSLSFFPSSLTVSPRLVWHSRSLCFHLLTINDSNNNDS